MHITIYWCSAEDCTYQCHHNRGFTEFHGHKFIVFFFFRKFYPVLYAFTVPPLELLWGYLGYGVGLGLWGYFGGYWDWCSMNLFVHCMQWWWAAKTKAKIQPTQWHTSVDSCWRCIIGWRYHCSKLTHYIQLSLGWMHNRFLICCTQASMANKRECEYFSMVCSFWW